MEHRQEQEHHCSGGRSSGSSAGSEGATRSSMSSAGGEGDHLQLTSPEAMEPNRDMQGLLIISMWEESLIGTCQTCQRAKSSQSMQRRTHP